MDIIVRKNNRGKYCGYVGVPKGHPLFGLDYNDELPSNIVNQELLYTTEQLMEKKGVISTFLSMMNDDIINSIAFQFDVHGGITFSNYITKRQNEPIRFYSEYLEKEIDTDYCVKCHKLIKKLNEDLSFGIKRLKELKNAEDINTESWSKKLKDLEYYYFRRLKLLTNLEHIINDIGNLNEILKDTEFYINKNGLFIIDKTFWYFGWDSAHYGDEENPYTEEQAMQETLQLKEQIEKWTIDHFNT